MGGWTGAGGSFRPALLGQPELPPGVASIPGVAQQAAPPHGLPWGSPVGLTVGLLQRKAQITCTAIFIVWGVLVHLVIPPFVFMVTEDWDYIEGLYYSFITISTIGFGDFVAGESLVPLAFL